MTGGAAAYVAIFLATGVLSFVLTPLAMRLALAHDIVDRPGGHKSHVSPVPYLGGLAIVVGVSLAMLVAAILRPPVSGLDDLVTILGLGVGLAVIGLADDIWGLPALPRLGAELIAGAGLWMVGVKITVTGRTGVDFVLTLLWVALVTNAFNLLDNMDGLSAGVATVAALWFFTIAAANGQFLVAGLSIAVAGTAIGFLRHNFHPARIYMGDSGALYLGFLLAAIGIRLRFDGPTQTTFLVPVLVLGVALFDTTLVTISRLAHHRSPFQGGRDHLSHRLVRVGIPVPAAVLLIYTTAAALGGLALVLSRVDKATGLLLIAVLGGVAIVLAFLLLAVDVYPRSEATGGGSS